MVPGHEIVGRVKAIGAEVAKFKVGDLVGVGCMVDSCLHCDSCGLGLEQFCEKGFTGTYNGVDRVDGSATQGGYSSQIVVREEFVLKVPGNLPLAAVAPLLCAGITTYSPLRHWKVGPGQTVGVIGLGGLGHMAVKFARAFGAHVVLFTTSANKVEDGLRLGAHEVVVSKDKATGGRIDVGVAVLDGLGLLLFIIPGVIAFAVDFATGTIYVPGGRHAAADQPNDLVAVKADRKIDLPYLEQVLHDKAGVNAHLDSDSVKVIEMSSLDETKARLGAYSQLALSQR